MVTFGHGLFAALLLHLAQRYAPDYCKLLYDKTAQVLDTVRTSVKYVVSGAAGASSGPPNSTAGREYFVQSPRELPPTRTDRWLRVDGGVLCRGGYMAGPCDPRNDMADEHGRKLLEALVIRGEREIICKVALYGQRQVDTVALAPLYFDLSLVSVIGGWTG